MQIPDKTKIGGVEYQTEFVKTCLLNNREYYGITDYEHSTIEIATHVSDRNRIGEQYQKITYLHELLHAVAFQYNIELPENEEEKIIESFARGLHQVIEDNKEIFVK